MSRVDSNHPNRLDDSICILVFTTPKCYKTIRRNNTVIYCLGWGSTKVSWEVLEEYHINVSTYQYINVSVWKCTWLNRDKRGYVNLLLLVDNKFKHKTRGFFYGQHTPVSYIQIPSLPYSCLSGGLTKVIIESGVPRKGYNTFKSPVCLIYDNLV